VSTPEASEPAGLPYEPQSLLTPQDQRLWATLIHIGGIFFGFIPALIGYLVLKDRGAFIRQHTTTALNFQISLVIYLVGVSILIAITLGIAYILFFAVYIAAFVFMIIAAVKANNGENYYYPLTIKFIK
jgi:uncharacterized Tic20 family protein